MKRNTITIALVFILVLSGFNSCNNADPNRIALPVCACIVEGATWTKVSDKPEDWIRTGNTTLTNLVNQIVYDANDNVWIPGADIAMIPQIGKDDGYIKVIDDPDRSVGKAGDIEGTPEGGQLVASKCREAWGNSLVPGGLVIIIAHNLINNDGSITGYSGYSEPYDAVLARNQHADLCSFPRNLRNTDVTGRYIVIEDPLLLGLKGEKNNGIPYVVLAHEFGHVLMLGHGDGLDNDNNGKQPGEAGLRLFDSYCDLTEYNQYDEQPGHSSSLMNKVSGYTTTITPLQKECARDIAPLLPGAAGPH